MNMARLIKDYDLKFVELPEEIIRFTWGNSRSSPSGLWQLNKAKKHWGSIDSYLKTIKGEQGIK